MTGTVVLAWSISHHILSGKPNLKISLRTGDEATARERWGQVHAQIEILLKRAIGKHKEQSAPAVEPKMAETLTFEQRDAISGQAKHDVLAQHDGNWGDASPLSPIAKGLAQAMYCRRNKIPLEETFSALLDKFYPTNLADKDIPPAARAAEAREIADMLIASSTDGHQNALQRYLPRRRHF
ncbi:MAG: hypothetical protein KGJ29_06060 [Hyphomicrobiales bacterium]|nr:hypothetical protein [Hyphomicrobiales bacterium]